MNLIEQTAQIAKVYKYEVESLGLPTFHAHFTPATIGVQKGDPVVWGMYCDTAVGKYFKVAFTGAHEFDPLEWELKDSVYDPVTGLAWHLLVRR